MTTTEWRHPRVIPPGRTNDTFVRPGQAARNCRTNFSASVDNAVDWLKTSRAAFSTRVAIEPVYCLGLCSVGPNAMIGDALYARLDPARLSALVESVL